MSAIWYERIGVAIIKAAIFLGAGIASLSFGQSVTTTYPQVVTASRATSPTLPSYVVYHHFLAWASALDQDAKKRGLADPHAFTGPFAQSKASAASAELDYMTSLFAHNLVKLSLARAPGKAETRLPQFLKWQ